MERQGSQQNVIGFFGVSEPVRVLVLGWHVGVGATGVKMAALPVRGPTQPLPTAICVNP
jgi:hypothetical protein